MSCAICDGDLADGEVVVVTEKGLRTLRKYSKLRNDGIIHLFQGIRELPLHTDCRRKYTKERDTALGKKYIQIPRKSNLEVEVARSSDVGIKKYPFHVLCFFCNRQANKNDDVLTISDEKTKETILKAISMRPSLRNEAILNRIEDIDLKKEQARYHSRCYFDCLSTLRPQHGLKRERPEDDVTGAMETIYQYMEETSDTQFTLKELKKLLKDNVPDNNTIVAKLTERYGKRICVTQNHNETLLSFEVIEEKDPNIKKNGLQNENSNNTNTETWHAQDDLEEDKLMIIKQAAEIIREDITLKVFNKEHEVNPPPQFFFEKATNNVPRALALFLETLGTNQADRDEIKIAAASNLLLVYRNI